MLPILAAIGTGLSVLSSVKTLMSGSSSTPPAQTPATATGTNAATAAAAASAPSSGAVSSTEQQDRFLKLLVTQMKNQDPLNPLDNAQVTSQLAQINTVSGIEKLNGTLQNLSTSFLAGQSLQSAALIGHQVLTDGNRLAYSGAPVAAGAELQQPADRVTVTIADAAGNTVRTLELGPQKAGVARFEWDGLNDGGARVADGAYSMRIAALRGGQQVTATPLAMGLVGSVSFGNDGLRVDVDGIGAIQLGQIKKIL